MVEHHARQGEGDHDDQAAGGGQAADIGGEHQPGILHGQADAEGEVLRLGGDAEAQAGPQDRRHRQAHQQQEQWQRPAGGDQSARVEVLGEGHVVHVRHDDGRGEEHQQQGAPGAFLQRRVQGGQRGLVLQQPLLEAVQAAEHGEQCIQADGGHGAQLDQRLEGDGQHQPLVPLAGGDMAGAEQDGEQGEQRAETQRHQLADRLAGDDADGIGHRLDLQGEQRQHGDQHEHRGQGAGPGAAKAKGEQVGQRGQLVGAGQAQDRVQQHRGQQEGAGKAQVDGQEAVAILVGEVHGAVERPGAGIHAQRQGVDQRVAHQRAKHSAALGQPGDAEQHQQVDGADQQQVGQVKARRHRAGSGG
ncbi:hypothetical protein D3C84_581470 [compost metagenome]